MLVLMSYQVERGGPPATTRPDRLEAAATYIRQTTERLERLRERKRELTSASSSQGSGSFAGAAAAEVEVQHLGSGLYAILVTGAPPSDGASFHRAVRAVEEAGGEVQNAHFSVVGARAIYTIHTLVRVVVRYLYAILLYIHLMIRLTCTCIFLLGFFYVHTTCL